MRFFSQLKLLLWKNLLLQRRKVVVSILEVMLPIFFAFIIFIVRLKTKPVKVLKPTIFNATSLTQKPYRFWPGTKIGFTPNTPLTRHLMQNVMDVITQGSIPSYITPENDTDYYLDSTPLQGFDTEKELEKALKDDEFEAIGVTFPGLAKTSSLTSSVTYYLRPPTIEGTSWETDSTYPFYQTGNPPRPLGYSYMVLLPQILVAQTLMREWTGRNLSFDISTRAMPFPPRMEDPMLTVLQSWLPLFLILSFILSVVQNVKAIVYEKEQQLKESMKLMGLIPSVHWTSWFITCFIYLAVAMAIYTVLFGIDVSKDSGPVLAYSDPSLFYVFLLCYAVALITFCFMISVFVQKANAGAAVGGIMFFAFYFPNFFLRHRYETMTSSQKLAACLLFNQAMAFGANVVGLFEGTGEGLRWSNVYKTASVDDNFSLLDSMLMLLLDSIIHLIITWYLDNVHPGKFGVPKPFYFCFMKSYWCGSALVKSDKVCTSGSKVGDHHFEQEPSGLRAGVRICNLTKVYGENKVAVKKLSLNMYEGQITVLLGHNGAGKTTTMSMLTGFISPSSGTAYINDLDIRTDIDSIRQSLGLCPQHNILFGSLSVEEHLHFFAKLKGCPASKVKGEVDTMVKEVGLEQKRTAEARTLSGGQKRKLSVAIALIAGSKIVVLDEPTSGMDPAARRQTWDVLQRHRTGRTLLLSTHFMDEADLLGDRIAILDKGLARCCGTSMFLKQLYGTGYHLVLVKGAECQVGALTETIQAVIPSAVLESEINVELTYLLQDDQSSLFADLFNQLDDSREKLRILNFGVTATTMEEVFLKSGETADPEEEEKKEKKEEEEEEKKEEEEGSLTERKTHKESSVNPNGHRSGLLKQLPPVRITDIGTDHTAHDIVGSAGDYIKLTGWSLVLSRVRALVMKKALHFWRNRVITVVQLLLPVIFTIIALALDKLRTNIPVQPPLPFNLHPFGRTTVAYSSGSNPNSDSDQVAEVYARLFRGDHSTEKVDLNQQSFLQFYIQKAIDLGTNTFNRWVIIGAEFEPSQTQTLRATSWYNFMPFHAEPVSLAYTLNALAKHYVNSSVDIRSGLFPLPQKKKIEDDVMTMMGLGFSVCFCISIGMAFLTTSFIFFLVKERSTGAKHMQVVSGVGPVVFWLSNLVWDYLNYLLPSLLLLLVFLAYGTEAFVEGGRLGLVTLVLALYGLAILPLVYLAHFIFTSPPTAMAVGIVFSIFTGLITLMTVFVMGIIPNTQQLGKTLNCVFVSLFPHHCMARAFMDIYFNYLILDFCTTKVNYTVTCFNFTHMCCKGIGMGCGNSTKTTCLDFTDDYLDLSERGLGRPLLAMVMQGLIFFTATILLEYGPIRRLKECLFGCTRRARPFSMTSEDDDVAAERRRVNASPASVLSQRESLLLVNLFKQYGDFVAVDHTCVGVPEEECFGLLGQNGAGKTTTFKMLTGDEPVTRGNAYLKGYGVKRNLKQVQANMGYCPQFDALIEQMTGRETLTMYGRLRGVPDSHIKTCVNNLIDVLLLRPHADKLTSDYSGGNKRKLSTAMALIGDPPFILLDEPSTGMDPGARRQLWNVLSAVRASGRTLVLTSHSMEECEALCTRIAIMVNGRFVCLGSTQYLKSKFGQGYTLVAKMDSLPDGNPVPIDPFVTFIQQTFPSACLFDSHQGYAHVQVPDPQVRLAQVFSAMEQAKQQLQVQAYHVHQTTLEQVFLAFTRMQVPPKESKSKPCLKRLCCCCRC